MNRSAAADHGETKRVFVFKEHLATHPQFYYFYAS